MFFVNYLSGLHNLHLPFYTVFPFILTVLASSHILQVALWLPKSMNSLVQSTGKIREIETGKGVLELTDFQVKDMVLAQCFPLSFPGEWGIFANGVSLGEKITLCQE